jgi:hypothetical protein
LVFLGQSLILCIERRLLAKVDLMLNFCHYYHISKTFYGHVYVFVGKPRMGPGFFVHAHDTSFYNFTDSWLAVDFTDFTTCLGRWTSHYFSIKIKFYYFIFSIETKIDEFICWDKFELFLHLSVYLAIKITLHHTT